MKRRAEFLVRKRDGRTEWLRSTKLARSIHLALRASGVSEEWRALDVAASVVTGLRQVAGESRVLRTVDLARSVERVLVAIGHPLAAGCYAQARAELAQRRSLLGNLLVATDGGGPPGDRRGDAVGCEDRFGRN